MNAHQPPATPDAEQHVMAPVSRQQPSPPTPIKRNPIPSRASASRQPGRCQMQHPAEADATLARRWSRRQVLSFLGLGGALGLVGLYATHWTTTCVQTILSQWHHGDAHITTLTASVGHSGTSQLLACYQQGYIVVIEFSHNSDPTHEHLYSLLVLPGDTTPRTVSLSVDDQRNLHVSIDGTAFSLLLKNTGDQFQTAEPQP